MRWIRGLLALGVLALGLLVGALNDAQLAVDLYFLQFSLSSGAALLGATLLGAVLAGLCLWLAVIWPLQRRLRQARRDLQQTTHSALEPVEQGRLEQDPA